MKCAGATTDINDANKTLQCASVENTVASWNLEQLLLATSENACCAVLKFYKNPIGACFPTVTGATKLTAHSVHMAAQSPEEV